MFLGLKDLSPDLFFDVDQEKVFIYLTDIVALPELTNILPLGSFGEDQKIKMTELPFNVRLKVGEAYLIRDNYAFNRLGNIYLDAKILLQEFSTIPKLVSIVELYSGGNEFFPISVFYDASSSIALKDLYYIINLYFSSHYRESNSDQLSRQYELLTDASFEMNTFTMITKISTFFFGAFKQYLGTTPDSIPFQCGFGTNIREAIQSKNDLVRRIQIENEINFFVDEFNSIYENEVQVQEISINNQPAQDGGDKWVVDIISKIDNEFIQFKLVQ